MDSQMTETTAAQQKHRSSRAVPLSRIQKLIARRMAHSKRTKPCFYIERRADTTELMARRHDLKKSLGVKITTNAFYIRALALAVRQFPLVVGVREGDNIRIADSINVGFAVNAPQGLVVPVIKQADTKSLADIARLEKALTSKARSNKLNLEEMEGETIALSNLGAYDIDSFFGIVPPPASVILAAGNTLRRAVPVAGNITPAKLTSFTLAADGTVITEPYAAQFLRHFAELLGNPQELI